VPKETSIGRREVDATVALGPAELVVPPRSVEGGAVLAVSSERDVVDCPRGGLVGTIHVGAERLPAHVVGTDPRVVPVVARPHAVGPGRDRGGEHRLVALVSDERAPRDPDVNPLVMGAYSLRSLLLLLDDGPVGVANPFAASGLPKDVALREH